ncbi:MAG: prepilin-type N-terminal cleavage/methylation domain-containing protein [Halobacteriovoraceae bacterium]|nr:prepilin-type N-terminal cleavage/methylation domain-containing protein [Halobacteriovoraceae bacterium]
MYPPFREGFTIIEVLLAMVLLSFIMLYAVTTIDDSNKTKDRVTEEDREFLQVEASLERINLDFTQIYSPLYYSFLGSGKGHTPSENFSRESYEKLPVPEILNPDKSTLIFYTAVNRRKLENSKQSNYAWVRYSLRPSSIEDPKKKRTDGDYELIRQYVANTPYIEEHNWDDVKEQLLVRHVKDMEFSFWSRRNKRFVFSLQELENYREELHGLKITLTWIDPNNNEREREYFYRPLWPVFSAEKERKQHLRELAKQKQIDQQKKQDNKKPPNTGQGQVVK